MVLDTKGKKVCNRVYGWCHKKDGHYSTTCPKNPNNFDKLQKVLNRGKGKRGRPRGSGKRIAGVSANVRRRLEE